MNRIRVTIGSLLVFILLLGMTLAGLRSGSNDWFTLIYSLTFFALAYAAIAARFRGPFWYGFAVAGWAYFVVGFGPWIGALPGSDPVNRNLVTSVILEVVSGTMANEDATRPELGIRAQTVIADMYRANRSGICHSALTIVFAVGGGWLAKSIASRVRADRPREE